MGGTEAANAGVPVPGQYIVVLKDSVERPGRVAARHRENRGARIAHVYGTVLNGYAAELSNAALAAVRQDPTVAYVEPDVHVEAHAQRIPTGIQRSYAINNPAPDIDGVDDVRVNADIAILDTGIDTGHSDLNVVGRVDCTQSTCVSNAGADAAGHGSHVAGIAAALDNQIGVVGVAPGARLWSVKVLSDNEDETTVADVIAGVDWVTARASQIEVINMSLGFAGLTGATPFQAAIGDAIDAGVVVVVSAGNDMRDVSQDPKIPGYFPDVITVSNLADFDGRPSSLAGPLCEGQRYPPADYFTGVFPPEEVDDSLYHNSNWGTRIDIAAPGTCIYSTFKGNGYATDTGTSMAAPHVSGAAAILAAAKNPNSRADVMAIRNQLVAEGNYAWTDDSGNGAYPPDYVTEPLLDLYSGPDVVTNIGVTSHTAGAMQVFARGQSGDIATKDYNPYAAPAWRPWGSLSLPQNAATGAAIPVVGSPAVTSRHSCCRDVFVRGTDNQIYFRNWDSNTSSWSQWYWIPGPNNAPVASSPGVTRRPDVTNGLTVGVRGSDGQIHIKTYSDATGWTGWAGIGAPASGITSAPSLVVHNQKVLHIFVRGGDGAVWNRAWSAALGWSQWVNLGGWIQGAPAAVVPSSGVNMWVFARGPDDGVHYRHLTDSTFSWSNWGSLGGKTQAEPAATSRDSSGVDLFVVGLDGRVQNRRFVNGSWTSWMRIDEVCTANTCTWPTSP